MRCRYKGTAGSVVATEGPATACSLAAQFFWGFIKENMGVVGHGV